MNNTEQMMTRYLLGELPESEQAALERKYFTDPKVFDSVVKAEQELIDNYVRGRLSPQVRARFEQYYLAHPRRRERMKFGEALVTRLDQIGEARAAARQMVETGSWWQQQLESLALGDTNVDTAGEFSIAARGLLHCQGRQGTRGDAAYIGERGVPDQVKPGPSPQAIIQ